MPVSASWRDRWESLRVASNKAGGGLYTRHVNRFLARPFTLLFWTLGLSPNWVTLLSNLATYSGLLLLVLREPTVATCVSAYLLLALGYVLDSSDGQLARVTGKFSKAGEWLDHSLDALKHLVFAVTLGYLILRPMNSTGSSFAFLYGVAATNAIALPGLFFLSQFTGQLLRLQPRQGQQRLIRRIVSEIVALLNDYGLRLAIVLLIPWYQLFVWAYGAYGVYAFTLLITSFTWTAIRAQHQGMGSH